MKVWAQAFDRPSRGFTLVEALVAILITGLIAAVTIQGLGSILSIQSSMSNQADRLHWTMVEHNIVIDPLKGIFPDYKDRPYVFRGSPQRIAGLTIRPLNDEPGAPRPFALRFASVESGLSTALIYTTDRGAEIEIARWQGRTGAFSYRDISGDWSQQWPPNDDESLPQTPWLIRVETGLESNSTIVAFVSSPHERRFRIQDAGFGGSN